MSVTGSCVEPRNDICLSTKQNEKEIEVFFLSKVDRQLMTSENIGQLTDF